ncbi:hypothetical protein ACFL96_18405, partial [Thermoproteota archaeon]
MARKKAIKKVKKKASKKKATKKKAKPAKRPKPVLRSKPVERVSISKEVLIHKAKYPKKERVATIFHHYPAQIISCVITLAIVMYFFGTSVWNSFDKVFFTIFTIATLVIADFFYRHEHKPHDAAIIGCVFFLPALATVALFNMLWAWVVVFLMLWALAGALFIYYRHRRGKHLTEVMWVSVYSHLLAFGAAIVLFALMSYIQPNMFLSGTTIILYYFVPPILLHFFISHYLYTHHFDPKHPVHDIITGLKYGLLFTLILFIALSALYVAMGVFNFNRFDASHKESVAYDLGNMDGIIYSMDRPPEHLEGLQVYGEVKAYIENTRSKAISRS